MLNIVTASLVTYVTTTNLGNHINKFGSKCMEPWFKNTMKVPSFYTYFGSGSMSNRSQRVVGSKIARRN